MKLQVILPFLVFVSLEHVSAQNGYIKLGQQALMDGDFKAAAAQLEKACLIDSTNANALWMLGYSYYHNENYKKAVGVFTKELAINPVDANAYYYRARAEAYMGKDSQLGLAEKEKCLLSAIFDLTKAISIDPDDTKNKYLQTRGIFYRDYGIFKLQASGHYYDKTRAIRSLRASISDLEKVLSDNPDRIDISAQIDESRQKLDEALAKR